MDGASNRLTGCLTAAAVLTGVTCAYVALSSRWLDIERQNQFRPSHHRPAASAFGPAVSRNRWFPERSWVHTAENEFHDGARHLYVNEFEILDGDALNGAGPVDGQSVEFRPVAMVFDSEDPQDPPIIVTSKSARLDLSAPLSLQNSRAGRIRSVWLHDDVRILGPKNLSIEGHVFYIDEKSMRLRSWNPVSFAFENHKGHAKGGIELILEHEPNTDDGLVAITGVKTFRLNGRVDCDLYFPARRRNEEAIQLEIVAADGFEYQMATSTGTFHGFPNRKNEPETQVFVRRITTGRPEVLICRRLEIEFYREISPDTGQPDGNRMRPGKLSAWGRRGHPALYRSPDQDVTARMGRLHYSVGERRLDLYGSDGSIVDQPHLVQIRQGNRDLAVPHLRVIHAQDSGIEWIECRGPGRIRQTPNRNRGDTSPVTAAVQWNRTMTIQPSADRRLYRMNLTGGGHVSLPEERMTLSGRRVSLVVHSEPEPPAGARRHDSSGMSLALTDARPKLLTAEGSVILRSPQGSGELTESLTVRFHEMKDSPTRVTPVSAAASTAAKQTMDSGVREDDSVTRFNAGRMEALVVLPNTSDSSGNRTEWRVVRLMENVTIRRRAADRSEEFTASGNSLHAVNGFGNATQMKLFGSPAVISSGTGYIEGGRIELNQQEGLVEINGPGQLRIVTDQELNDRPLPDPVPVDIYWTDRMTLRGETAHFVGSVRAVAAGIRSSNPDSLRHDIQMQVPEMKVHFDEPVHLSGDANQRTIRSGSHARSTPRLQQIECVGRTRISLESLLNDAVDSRHRAELVDLTLNLPTGDFTALGPGWIQSTNPSDNPQLQLGSAVRAVANAPAEIHESVFARVHASFIGRMAGNFRHNDARLYDHVTATFVLVRDLDEQIDLESLATDEMPDRSGILRSEEMEVSTIPGTDDQHFAVTARHNARIESPRLAGDADVITYDNSKQQYVLTADENRTVTVHHRAGGTGQYETFIGPRFVYYEKTGQINAIASEVQAAD